MIYVLERARKAQHNIAFLLKNYELDVDLRLEFWRSKVLSIVVDACEIWTPNKSDMRKIESFQTISLKSFLGCPIGTADAAVLSDSGFRHVSMEFARRKLRFFRKLQFCAQRTSPMGSKILEFLGSECGLVEDIGNLISFDPVEGDRAIEQMSTWHKFVKESVVTAENSWYENEIGTDDASGRLQRCDILRKIRPTWSKPEVADFLRSNHAATRVVFQLRNRCSFLFERSSKWDTNFPTKCCRVCQDFKKLPCVRKCKRRKRKSKKRQKIPHGKGRVQLRRSQRLVEAKSVEPVGSSEISDMAVTPDVPRYNDFYSKETKQSSVVEDVEHFTVQCTEYNTQRNTLKQGLNSILTLGEQGRLRKLSDWELTCSFLSEFSTEWLDSRTPEELVKFRQKFSDLRNAFFLDAAAHRRSKIKQMREEVEKTDEFGVESNNLTSSPYGLAGTVSNKHERSSPQLRHEARHSCPRAMLSWGTV